MGGIFQTVPFGHCWRWKGGAGGVQPPKVQIRRAGVIRLDICMIILKRQLRILCVCEAWAAECGRVGIAPNPPIPYLPRWGGSTLPLIGRMLIQVDALFT